MLYQDVLNLGYCDFIEINQEKELEKWHELRTTGIGGSDAGAIIGLNEYSSPLEIYLQKKGKNTFNGNVSTEWGRILENPIREKAAEELNVKIETIPGMLRSKKYSFMNANLDSLIFTDKPLTINNRTVQGLGGHEIKTSANGHGFEEDEIPDSYYSQIQHYMSVTGLTWFVLTVFFLSSKTAKHYIVKENTEFQKSLIEEELDFWENYVMKDTPPAPNGSDNESTLLKSLDIGGEFFLTEEKTELLKKRELLKQQEKELSKQIQVLENELLLELQKLSTNTTGNVIARCGDFKLTLSTQYRKTIDSEALKKAGLYNQYLKESACKVFRISGGKERI